MQVIEWCIALAQRYGIAEAIENGQQLAEAPDTGVVQLFGGAAPLAPEPLEGSRIRPIWAAALASAGVFHFK